MKKLLLSTILALLMGGLFAQYTGQSFNGTPWSFGTDSLSNFSVGQAMPWKNGGHHGVPHYAYDVGTVDTMLLPSADPTGLLVAGSGYADSGQKPSNDSMWRQGVAAAGGITLHNSDMAAQGSENFGGNFTTHNNRATANGTAGWYRYTCNFVDGNYKMLIRGWGASKSGHGFWVRFYDPQTMTPLYPWTRIHPGESGGNTTNMENAAFVDLSETFYDTTLTYFNTKDKKPAQSEWIQTVDEFSLNGDVVVEYANMGPTVDHDVDVTGSGAAFWGSFTFMHQGDASDKFAPVAEPYRKLYDDMEEISVKLNEDGTLYLVPNGTAIEDAETAAIDMLAMTTSDTYTKAVSELTLTDTIQLVTKDAAGNARITSNIRFRAALTAQTTQGDNTDTIFVNASRAGWVILVQNDVSPDYTSFTTAINTGLADTVNVSGGNDSLIITNLSGNMNCNLYLFDGESGEISNPVAYTLGEGVVEGVDQKRIIDVTVYAAQDQIMINHNGDFKEIAIYDILGKQHMLETVNADRFSLNADKLPAGVYILKMYGNSAPISKKFLLRK
jgi:hypothetical protein